ncbi:hypothetical protein EGP91_03320 [bacterium]|uniref:hypothetical protein n=1 Tax=Candidatus Ventrenecus sp. TaxID=3085654 RepID=UPI001DF45965|nr:hypothetical protein [bacterium]
MKEEDFTQMVEQNKLVHIKDNLYLTNYQREVLEEYHIPYQNVKSNKDLLFYLSEIGSDEEYDELENVARELADYSYYHETHK